MKRSIQKELRLFYFYLDFLNYHVIHKMMEEI